MKYQVPPPQQDGDANVNVSHQHPLREFLLILAGLSLLGLFAFWALGLAVDLVVDRLDPADEARLHRALAVELRRPADMPLDERRRQELLQQRINDLRACAGIAYPVSVQLISSATPNAVVLPGAHIAVFSGLLDRVETENGLDFVLAHELAHLKHRDHLRGMGRSLVLIAASVMLTGSHSDFTQILVPSNQLGLARHSQARETAADEGALDILNCRHRHVGGASEFFDNLRRRQAQAPAPLGLSHYFASHPLLDARIAHMQRHALARGYALKPASELAPLPPQLRAPRNGAG